MTVIRTLVALSLVATVSCGGAEPAPQVRAPEAPKTAARPKPKQRLSMSGQLGSLDEGKVEDTFNRLVPRFGDCLAQGASRVEFIGGHVKIFVRIAVDGSAKWAYLPESTIGDRGTEKCML